MDYPDICDFIDTFLVPIASVIVGSLLTLLGTHITSKRAYDSQIKTAAINAFIANKFNAYKELEITIEAWALNKNDDASKVAVYRAANVAALVASQEIITAIANVQKMILDFNHSSTEHDKKVFQIARLDLLEKMHSDLLVYPMPNAAKDTKTKCRRSQGG